MAYHISYDNVRQFVGNGVETPFNISLVDADDDDPIGGKSQSPCPPRFEKDRFAHVFGVGVDVNMDLILRSDTNIRLQASPGIYSCVHQRLGEDLRIIIPV